MFAFLTGVVQVAASAPAAVGASLSTLVLAAGCVIGALINAWAVRHQDFRSRETVFDAALAIVMGGLWNYPFTVPIAGVHWPVMPITGDLSQQFLAMLFIGLFCLGYAKRILVWAVPTLMERAGVPREVINGNGKKSEEPPKPV